MIPGIFNRNNGNNSSYTDIPSVAETGNSNSSSSHDSNSHTNRKNRRGMINNNISSNNDFHFCDVALFCREWSMTKILGVGIVLLLLFIVVFDHVDEQKEQVELKQQQQHERAKELNEGKKRGEMKNNEEKLSTKFKNKTKEDIIPMPSGVNFGSWLSLEDYFFAGNAAVEVATPGFGEYRVAACLPPMHVGRHTGPKWYSETDLFGNMSTLSSVAHAVSVFQAHRNTFVDLEQDLDRLASLNVTNIRVPISWCITNYDPRKVDLNKTEEAALLEMFTCEDPFFGKEVLWPAVPKAIVEDFLRACHKHGVKAALDIHTYPGGTSIGTFSGVWPRWPKFWTDGDVPSTNKDQQNIGHVIFQQFVHWMESLSVLDPLAFAGLRGLSPMNEPAHLAGLFGGNHPTDKNFLPPLPKAMTKEYLDNLTLSAYNSQTMRVVPDGTHLRVFYWFQSAIDIFRRSNLPQLGKELHANIHESILSSDYLAGEEEFEKAADSVAIIASWWCSTTTPEERSSWSILDMHHYNAWSPECSGTVDGQGAGYACGDEEKRNKVLNKCTQSAAVFRQMVDEQCGKGSKLMSAEFSAATHHSVRKSCNSVSNLQESYVRQVNVAKESDVELFYWSYHMPYGGPFRRAWSFQHLMYLMGVVKEPDEPQFECNDHIADVEEPNDDVWQH